MKTPHDAFPLHAGIGIPTIGFGTWQLSDGAAAYDAVSHALANGYRHSDTVHTYGNEASVCRAIRDSSIARDTIFVTSKLPTETEEYDEALARFEAVMAQLRLDYLDLHPTHAPWLWGQMGEDFSARDKATSWAFETLHTTCCVRAIGVSSFEFADVDFDIGATDMAYLMGSTDTVSVHHDVPARERPR